MFEQNLIENGYTILKFSLPEQQEMAAKVRAEIWPMMEETVGKEILDRLLTSLQ